MTIGLIIIAVFIGIAIIGVGAYATTSLDWGWKGYVISILIAIIVVVAILGIGYWYFNNTASGARALKNQQSNLSNGLMREIIITAEDGREIFHYTGKCDIETNTGYILFEGEDGLRRIIYYGALDTIIIEELSEK